MADCLDLFRGQLGRWLGDLFLDHGKNATPDLSALQSVQSFGQWQDRPFPFEVDLGRLPLDREHWQHTNGSRHDPAEANLRLCAVPSTGTGMAHDPRISEIFYYFEQHTNIASGRTVGRKIGVVQEILCKKLLTTSPSICDCILYEPKMPGLSGATHKIEFVLFQPMTVIELSIGKSYSDVPGIKISVTGCEEVTGIARLTITGSSGKAKKATVAAGMAIKVEDAAIVFKVVNVTSTHVRLSVLDLLRPVASIESKRVGAQRFSGTEKLGSGIQTIEKAKQTSLVAIDLDLKNNKTILCQTPAGVDRTFRSFVILGNGVHWTNHDLAILGTYVDYSYLASDAGIVRYADFVKDIATQKGVNFFEFFMEYFQGMTIMPADSFAVTDADFVAMRPTNAGPLLKAVEKQIQPYQVQTI